MPRDNVSDCPCQDSPQRPQQYVRFVRDSELEAVNSAKSEAMPGFVLRRGGIVGFNRMPVKVDKSGMR